MSATCGNLNEKNEDRSIAIELDCQSEKNEGAFLALRKERKPILVNTPITKECINVCTFSMTDVGIQTCNIQGIGFQHNFSGFQENVSLFKRKHACQNAHEAGEPVQPDNMRGVILLKIVDNNGA